MADSKKKKTVESPTSRERAVVKTPAEESSVLVQGLDSIFDEFRRSFDDLMAPFTPMRAFLPRTIETLPIRAPLVDVIDDGNQYLINVELPGFDKEDVEIELNKDILVLQAEKKSEEEDRSQNYLHREQFYTSCHRTINFPEEVDPTKVEGTMEKGLLKLTIPKREPKPEERMTKLKIK
jgi:HSP20 family protein